MKKWTLIFNSGREVRCFSISEGLIFLIFIFLGLLAGAFSYTIIEGNKKKALVKEYEELKVENKNSLAKIKEVKTDVYYLQENIEKIGWNNTLLLLASELKPVSKSVKQMGVGGFPESKKFYYSEIDSSVKEVERQVNKVQNLISLEGKSLEESREKLDKLKRQLSHTPSIWPTYGWVSSGFGWRIHPITKKREFHKGCDIANLQGTPVVATADGIVTSTKWRNGFGRTVIIDHGYGFLTRYAHLKDIYVRKGQKVKRRQRIGAIGTTGLVTGPHLHYEVRVLNHALNPSDYLDTFKNTY
ncbi:MAG: M23 family metallopeptidase [candidate division WOR-3 bacterium]|nr:M23 family metallopeptidase [candidate division WOR-3 bacterium]